MRTGYIEIDDNHAISIDENNNKSLVSKSNNDYSFNEIFTKEENLRKLKEKLKSKRALVENKEINYSFNQLLFKIIYTTLSIIVLLSSIGITISLVLSNLYIFSILYAIPGLISINSLINEIKDYIVINKDLKEFKLFKEDVNKLNDIIVSYEKYIKAMFKHVEFKEEYNEELIASIIKDTYAFSNNFSDTIVFKRVEDKKLTPVKDDTIRLVRDKHKLDI